MASVRKRERKKENQHYSCDCYNLDRVKKREGGFEKVCV